MPDFAANLSTMFIERPLLDRFQAAARCGFDAVELASTEGVPAPEIVRRLAANGLTLIAWHLTGDTGGAAAEAIADPEAVPAFREATRRGLDEAVALSARFVALRAGATPPGCRAEDVERTVTDNLRFAARYAMASGLHLLLEAVDTASLSGACPNCTRQAVALIDASGARNLSLLYDVCHMQAMGEAVGATIARYLPRIGHIHIAGYPGRDEPLNGAIDFVALLDQIDRLGHRGWVGCDYRPAAGTEGGLGWLARHRRLTPSCRSVWGIPQAALEETSLRSRLTHN